MTNKIPKNQHWVPQFYLSHFGTEESIKTKKPKVWVWDNTQQSSLPAPLSVRNICGQRYLYSPEDPDGIRNPDIENMFGKIENVAAKTWPHLMSGNLDLNDPVIRKFIAEFISILHLRNVHIYRAVDNIIELRDKLYGKPSEEFLNTRIETDPDPTHSGRFFINTMLRNIDTFTKKISQKRLMVLASSDAEFFTCDRPVVFSHKKTLNPKSEIYFPLSPNYVLVSIGDGDQPKNYMGNCPIELVSNINQLLELQSLRFVISAKPRSEYLPSIIDED